MDARAIITRLRDGQTPSAEELRWFAAGLADGGVSDAQAGAFAMAVLLKGLGEEGRVALTRGMRDLGHVLNGTCRGRSWTSIRRVGSAIVCPCCWRPRWRLAAPMCR